MDVELEKGLGGYLFIKGTNKRWHREVYKKACGPIQRGWVIHHVDANKRNNDLRNLIAMPRKMHDAMHEAHRKFPCRPLPTRDEIAGYLLSRRAKVRRWMQSDEEKAARKEMYRSRHRMEKESRGLVDQFRGAIWNE